MNVRPAPGAFVDGFEKFIEVGAGVCERSALVEVVKGDLESVGTAGWYLELAVTTPGDDINEQQLPDLGRGDVTNRTARVGVFDGKHNPKGVGTDRLTAFEGPLEHLAIERSGITMEGGMISVSVISGRAVVVGDDEPERVTWWVEVEDGHVPTMTGGCDKTSAAGTV